MKQLFILSALLVMGQAQTVLHPLERNAKSNVELMRTRLQACIAGIDKPLATKVHGEWVERQSRLESCLGGVGVGLKPIPRM